VDEGRQRVRVHRAVVLEHRVQAHHRHTLIGKLLMHLARLRNGVHHATGAQHLRSVNQHHLPAQIGHAQRLVGVEPLGDVPFGHRWPRIRTHA